MFNTYVFQVGLVSLLLQRFRALLMVSAVYLTLSICFHCWVMVRSSADQRAQSLLRGKKASNLLHPLRFVSLQNLRWLDSNAFVWTDGLQALFVFQRTCEWLPSVSSLLVLSSACRSPALLVHSAAAVLYYYLYKRTAEYMGDPRLYEDSLWLREAFARARQ